MNFSLFDTALFDFRVLAQSELDRAGFIWFQHYASIDLAHDVGGLEVCGIPDRADAERILSVLQCALPHWQYYAIVYNDIYRGEPAWEARISQRDDPPSEIWT